MNFLLKLFKRRNNYNYNMNIIVYGIKLFSVVHIMCSVNQFQRKVKNEFLYHTHSLYEVHSRNSWILMRSCTFAIWNTEKFIILFSIIIINLILMISTMYSIMLMLIYILKWLDRMDTDRLDRQLHVRLFNVWNILFMSHYFQLTYYFFFSFLLIKT